MLTTFRRVGKSWIVYFIVGLIILTFAFFGIGDYFSGNYNQDAFKVGDVSISVAEYNNVLQNQRQRLQAEYGDRYDQVVNQGVLREQVGNGLISRAIWENKAQQFSMTVSHEKLIKVIREFEEFQTDGAFDIEKYRATLRQAGYPPSVFEVEQQKQLALSQVQNLFTVGGFQSETELEHLLRLQNQERNIAFLTFNLAAYIEAAEVSEDEIKQQYDDNVERYKAQPNARVDYVILTRDSVRDDLNISDDDIQIYYEDNLNLYTTAEERNASHILIALASGADEAATANALKQAQEVKARIDDGEDFAKVAKEVSQDPGSAELGGNLGYFGRGQMTESFEETVWSLQEGEISELVKSEFGYHIIQLNDIQAAIQQPLDEVKDTVLEAITNERLSDLFSQKMEDLTALAFENPDSLENITNEMKLTKGTTVTFDRTGQIVGDQQDENTNLLLKATDFLKIAFSEQILTEKLNSDLIQIDDNSVAVIRINTHNPEKQLSFDEVRDQIEASLKQQAAVTQTDVDAANWLNEVREGNTTLKTLATQEASKVAFQDAGWISRQSAQVPDLAPIVGFAYRVPKAGESESSFELYKINLGRPVIVELKGVRDGNTTTEDATAFREQYVTQLSQLHSVLAVSSALDLYRKDINVRRYELTESDNSSN